MDNGFEQKVRERAYEIWMANGMSEGMALEHWCAAEHDIMAVKAQPIDARAAAKTAVTATAAKAAAPRKAAAKPTKAAAAKPAVKRMSRSAKALSSGMTSSAMN